MDSPVTMNDVAAGPPMEFEFAPVAPELASAFLIYWEVRSTGEAPIIDQMHPDWGQYPFQAFGRVVLWLVADQA